MAATNVGSLAATLSLNAKGFSSGVDDARKSLGGFVDGIKSVGTVAAGVLAAGAVTGLIQKIGDSAKDIAATVESMQHMEKTIQSLAASEIVKASDGMVSYTDAIGAAGETANETMEYIRKLALVSPFEYQSVVDAFTMNAAMGQSVDLAKLTTSAILNLGSGLAMTNQEMSGFAVALAQTGATGKITAADLKQFANNRFGIEKLNDVFKVLTKNTSVQIATYEDFNNQIAAGKITTDDFFYALSEYAERNYSGSVELMSGTIGGLRSTLNDIKFFAKSDLFKPLGDSAAKAFAPIVGYLADFLGEGGFKNIGTKIEKWFQPAFKTFDKIGKSLSNGTMKIAAGNLKKWFQGSADEGNKFRIAMGTIFGTETGDKIFSFVSKLRGVSDWFSEHKDGIIGAIKGIAIAFGTLAVIGTITGLLSSLLNPLNLVLLAAGLLGAAWSTNFLGIQDTVSGFMKYLEPQITQVKDYIQSLKDVFDKTGIGGVVNKIKTDIVNLIPQSVIDAATSFKNTIVGLIPEDVKNAASDMATHLAKWHTTLKTDGLGTALTQMKSDLTAMLQPSVIQGLGDAAKFFNDIQIAVVTKGLVGGISKFLEKLGMSKMEIYSLRSAINDEMIPAINKLVETIGKLTDPTLAQTIIGLIGGEADDTTPKVSTLSRMLQGLADDITFFSTIINAGLQPFVWMKEKIQDVANAIGNFKENWVYVFGDGEKRRGVVRSSASGLLEELGTIFNGIVSLANPFSLFGEKIGGIWGDKFGEKVGDNKGSIKQSAKALITDIDSTLQGIIGVEKPVQTTTDKILGFFELLYMKLVGNSIVPDMVRDIENVFTKAKDGIVGAVQAITDPIIGLWNNVKNAVKSAWDWIFGKNGNSAGMATTEVATMVTIDPTVGISEEVLASYDALNEKIASVNGSIRTLNGLIGNGENGLSFLLSGLSLYIADTMTTTFTDFGALIGIGGIFGNTLEDMNRRLSAEGSTTSTLQVLTLIDTFVKETLTKSFTDYGVLINEGGTFGLALENVNRRLSTEGSTTSMLQVMQQISAYILGDFTKTHQTMAEYWAGAYTFAIDSQIWLLWTSPNSLYNAYGAIFGVLGDIYEKMSHVVERIRSELIPAFKETEEPAGIFQGAVESAASMAASLAQQAWSAAAAVRDLAAAMAEYANGSSGLSSLPGMANVNPFGGGKATGGPVRAGLTYLVGEVGPELFTPRRSGYITPSDKLDGGASSGSKTTNININGDIYGENHLRHMMRQEAKMALQEAEFHGYA